MPDFVMTFDPAYGTAVPVGPGICRLTAPNPGAFTFRGTNTYIIGSRRCIVVDPGPDDDTHLAALMATLGERPVDAILLTHTHRDHTGLVARLQQATAAPLLGGGVHRPSRPLLPGEQADSAGDTSLAFDRILSDAETLEMADTTIGVIATPGHCANHLAFSVGSDGVVLSGDHVMAWSTTVIAPPDGSMRDYMNSLEKMLERDDSLYLPGHGGAVARPRSFVRSLIQHRRMREAAILKRLAAGDQTTEALVSAIYTKLDPALRRAAALSVLAHLEALAARGEIVADGPPTLSATYRLA